MLKTSLLIISGVLLVSGCVSTKKSTPSTTGKVAVVVQKSITDEKTGVFSIETKRLEEVAARSVNDKGSEALLTPQKYKLIGDSFLGSYSIGADDEILASIYNQNGRSGSDLWILKSGKMRLTKTNYFNLFPSFTSDSKNVYYVSNRGKRVTSAYDQNSYIWRMKSNGLGGVTRIGTPTFAMYEPRESHDGENILFSSNEYYENSAFIWVMNKNGTLPTQLTQGFNASWINDESIVFSTIDENTGRATIWTTNIDGSNLTQIISDESMDMIQPEFDPTGKFVVYVSQTPNNNSSVEGQSRDIYVYNVDTGLSQQITTNISRDDLPKWSKEGDYIYFRSSRGLSWNIWRVKTNSLIDTLSN